MERNFWLKLSGAISKLKTCADIENFMKRNTEQLQKRLKLEEWDALRAIMKLKYCQGVFDTY